VVECLLCKCIAPTLVSPLPPKIVNTIIAEKFPNLGKEMSIQVQKAFRIPNRQRRKDFLHIML
jgi:hypothetical protein